MGESGKLEEINYYKPNVRFIIPIINFHCPKKLFNSFKKKEYNYKINNNFLKVINLCKDVSRKDNGTWINQIIIDSYEKLHEIGVCHTVECYDNQNLIGGLYGVHLGSCFFGESMFSLKNNTSKYCLLYLIAILKKNNFTLLDSQFYNHHLLQFGAYEIDNIDYQNLLNKGLKNNCNFRNIKNFQEVLSLIQATNQRS